MRNKDVNQSVTPGFLTTFPTSYSRIEKYNRISVFFIAGFFSCRSPISDATAHHIICFHASGDHDAGRFMECHTSQASGFANSKFSGQHC